MNAWISFCAVAVAVAMVSQPVAADPFVAKGLALDLVSLESSVRPGQTVSLGVVLRPDKGFHTYWRQPGLVGLTPTVEWILPEGFQAGEMLWPEPERGTMAAYGVWCLKREVCLVTPVAAPATLDPSTTPYVTLKAKVVWMACARTCHPGNAELMLTLPVRSQEAACTEPTSSAALIAQTRREQPIVDETWKFTAVQHGSQGGFSLTITPPLGQVVPADAYFYGHQRLIDSNVEPARHPLPDGAVRIDLSLVEEADSIPKTLIGELWSAQGWGKDRVSRLLQVTAPLTLEPASR